MPFGAELLDGGRTRFRLWAPSARSVELVIAAKGAPRTHALEPTSYGWCELVTNAPAGTRYRYRIGGELAVPDPASRCNPDDVHGESEVIDPRAFDWPDTAWRGRPWTEAVIYELHVGTFSAAGTFAGLEAHLDYLAGLGVTALELMPIADFPRRRNWGYDGVLPFAPDSMYGRPDDLKRLVAAAHERSLMVMLDVVYNHFGPDGNYLHAYAAPFFTDRHHTAWGDAINFDGAQSRTVRDFFIHNALYWLEEFHLDGLRFDAVHAILDDSQPHILVELAEAVRNGPGRSRHIHLVLENDRNEAHLLSGTDSRPRWYDGQWNDDFHHPLHILLTGEKDAYYVDYADAPTRHLGRALTEGYAYQGEASAYRDNVRRGESTRELPLSAFVSFLQNHDQIGNRACGERLVTLTDERRLRAATVALMLSPAIPLLFMGDEFGALTPFLFFCDFESELAEAVSEGRGREFGNIEGPDPCDGKPMPDPNDAMTFLASKLDWASLDDARHAAFLSLYKNLIALRMRVLVPRLAGMQPNAGAFDVLAEGALIARWRLGDGSELALRLNLADAAVRAPEPPRGEMLYCEPQSAIAALNAGEMPAASAAFYLLQTTQTPGG